MEVLLWTVVNFSKEVTKGNYTYKISDYNGEFLFKSLNYYSEINLFKTTQFPLLKDQGTPFPTKVLFNQNAEFLPRN